MAIASTTKFPPGPKGSPVLGNIPDIRSKGLIDFYYDIWSEYGDISSMQVGPLRMILVAGPEHIQHVMVKNPDKYIKGTSHDKLRNAIGDGILTLEGDPWKRQRQLMQPTYTPRGIRQYAEMMSEEGQAMAARWAAQTGSPIDLNLEMTRTTISVISRAMFGVDVSQDHKLVGESLHQLLEYTSNSTNRIIDAPLFIPTPKNQRLKQAKAIIHDFIHGIIKHRRDHGLQEDLLSMLMSAIDENTGKPMDDEQLHDEILITLFAGHETTASLLTWTWYLLSQHPEIEIKLQAELSEVLAGRTPTLDDLPRLTYTRMILDEALRLYSPVAIMARDVTADDTLDGYSIPEGSMVVIFPYATHRHPAYWERPLTFYPEHFTPEAVEQRPRYAYYPFGAGHRICIGSHFALMESTLIFAEVAQRFSLQLASRHNGDINFIGVLRPSKPVMMNLMPR